MITNLQRLYGDLLMRWRNKKILKHKLKNKGKDS